MPTAAHDPRELNDEQRAVVAHGSEPLLVVAGAGTGKTATLAARAAALVQRGVSPHRLMLVTFSRRAALELRRRVELNLRLAHGIQARGGASSGTPWHLPWCGTFHSLAARLLHEEAVQLGLATGFTVLDRGDAEELMGLVRQELGLAATGRRFPSAGTCLALHGRCVDGQRALEAVVREDYPWCEPELPVLAELFTAYARAKRAQVSLDFEDLLLAWWHLLQENALAERVRARFDAVLVDEAQDMNRLQAAIVHALRPSGAGLTLVGDDAQSIYGFRGAEVETLLEFPARFSPPARLLTLARNYRSTQPLLAASNAVIALAPRRFTKDLHSARLAGAKPGLFTVADEAAQAGGVAQAVLAAREQGLVFKRQAVLFRASHHSAALELELTRRRIPFVKYGGLRFVESAHVKDVLAVLRWADNPAAALAAWRVARLVPGVGPAAARRLADACHDIAAYTPPPRAAAAWAELRELIEALRSDAIAWPDGLHRVLAWYRHQLERLHDDAASRWLDLQQLANIAATHPGRERFLTELALDPPAASSDESGDPHRDEDYLILSTIHSAKGQEYSAVHVLNVVDGCMPADLATGNAAQIEEERRLLYVAMTRAREALTLWVPQRFYVTQQRALGDRHLYALRSRFIPDELLGLFDCETPVADDAEATDAMRGPAELDESPAGTEARASAAQRLPPPAFDLMARLQERWSG